MQYISYIIEGFTINLFTTAVAVVAPLIFGILLSIGAKKSSVIESVYNWLKIPFESLAIPVVIVMVFYIPALLFDIPVFAKIDRFFYQNFDIQNSSRIIIVTVTMSIVYLWYMPGRYDRKYSFLRNTLYNGLGLVSSLFKWSFVASLLSVRDILGAALHLVAQKAILWPLFLAFVVTLVILGVIEIGRAFIKQFMK